MKKNQQAIEQITKEIYDYTKRGKFLDEKAIEKIIYNYFSYFNISPKTNDITFLNNDSKGDTICSYNHEIKTIIIKLDRLNNISSNKINYESQNEKEYEKLLEMNLHTVFFVLHELCHINQIRKVKSSKNDLETIILKEALNFIIWDLIESYDEQNYSYIKSLSNLYTNNFNFYKINPAERIADIDAKEQIINILKDPVFKNSKSVKLYETKKLLDIKDENYDKLKSPTLTFLYTKKLLAPEKEKEKLTKLMLKIEKDKYFYTLNERLRMGLSIGEFEEKLIDAKKNILMRKRKNVK